jgi:hypothetical protein
LRPGNWRTATQGHERTTPQRDGKIRSGF